MLGIKPFLRSEGKAIVRLRLLSRGLYIGNEDVRIPDPLSPDLTCRDDVEGAGLRLLTQLIGRPAEDGAVVQLVEGRVNQLG